MGNLFILNINIEYNVTVAGVCAYKTVNNWANKEKDFFNDSESMVCSNILGSMTGWSRV